MSDSAFDLGTNSQVPLTAVETDSDGSAGSIPPVWTSSDETVLTLQDQGDGSVLALRATKAAGSVVVTASVTNADGTAAAGTLTLSLAEIVPPVVDVVDVAIVPGSPS